MRRGQFFNKAAGCRSAILLNRHLSAGPFLSILRLRVVI